MKSLHVGAPAKACDYLIMNTLSPARVGIIDYQAGNVHSIRNALEHLGADVTVVHTPEQVDEVSHLLLPGVGAFGHCATRLRESRLLTRIRDWAFEEQRPLLGICVGMQLMAEWSEELGHQHGLDWMGGTVERLPADVKGCRVPHVGWNTVRFLEGFGDFMPDDSADFYFDHSYAFTHVARGRVIGSCWHGRSFPALIAMGSIVAAQFHPEKSQSAGLRLLSGFLKMPSTPVC